MDAKASILRKRPPDTTRPAPEQAELQNFKRSIQTWSEMESWSATETIGPRHLSQLLSSILQGEFHCLQRISLLGYFRRLGGDEGDLIIAEARDDHR